MSRYAPGDWLAVVAAGGAVLVPADTPAGTVDALWTALVSEPELGDIVQALAGGRAIEFAGLRSFAAVVADRATVRIVVRGPLQVTLATAEGWRTVDGTRVATWREETVDAVDGVVLAVAGAAMADTWPLTAGVVKASRLEFTPAASATRAPAATPTAAPAGLEPARSGGTRDPAGLPATPGPPGPVPPSPPAPPAPAASPAEPTGLTTVMPPTDLAWGPRPSDGRPESHHTTSYDHLFDDPTRLSTAEEAAVRESGPASGSEPPDEADPDHDGLTVAKVTPMGVAPTAALLPAGVLAEPAVLARLCPGCGRPNSTLRPACTACGTALTGDPQRIVRPVLGELALSTGERIPLDRPVIIGRKPRAPRFSNQDVPRLVTVDSPQQDISRSHLKIDLEDWSVLVSDLGSTNGTVLKRPGQPDRRLQGPEQVVAQAGDVYDLGDGITVQVVSLT
jgi:hypothetical protein